MSAKKIGGGKLSRSETVTVRLDPKLRYLAELAARKQRRTLSSYIEWAIEENLQFIPLAVNGMEGAETISNLASELWDVDEADRFVKLAIGFSELLTHEEQILWKLIRENGYVWYGRYKTNDKWTWNVNLESIIYERLREHWELFKSVASGEADKGDLPKITKKEAVLEEPIFNLDDEIPF